MDTTGDVIIGAMRWLPRRLSLLLAVALLVGGCVELEQAIEIRADGGARLALHYSVPLESYAVLAETQAIIQDWQGDVDETGRDRGLHWFFNEALAREYFSGPNLSLESYRVYDEDDRRHVELVCEASNLSQELRSGRLGDFRLTKTDGDVYRLDAELARTQYAETRLSAQDKDLLREITRGLVIELTVRTPTPILETSGEKVDARRVVWRFDAEEDWWFLFETPAVFVTFEGGDLRL